MRTLVCHAITVAALSASALADLPRYLLVELPPLGGTSSAGLDMNDSGLVIGISTRPGEFYEVATTWQLGSAAPLAAPQPRFVTGSGFSATSGNGVNAHGQLVGLSDELGIAAFLGTVNGVGVVPSMATLWGEAVRINDLGTVVGQFSGPLISGWRPFVVRNGSHIPLPTLGGLQGIARGISNTGHIVGESEPAIGLPVPTRWVNDQPVELPGLGGWGGAYAVNDSGVAVGFTSPVGSSPYSAVLWSASGQLMVLPKLDPTHWDHRAFDINAAGQIVGVSGGRAFLHENGRIIDLNTVTKFPDGTTAGPHRWILHNAFAITEGGKIVGDGSVDQQRRGFVLLPRCTADADANGLVDVSDLFRFLNDWFAGIADADIDLDGSIASADLFAFLNRWFARC